MEIEKIYENVENIFENPENRRKYKKSIKINETVIAASWNRVKVAPAATSHFLDCFKRGAMELRNSMKVM